MPEFPSSFHHIDHSGTIIYTFINLNIKTYLFKIKGDIRNPYEEAIISVGEIIEFYDYDKLFPTWGFGGRIQIDNQSAVSHCFALNGNEAYPECTGVSGILSAYKQSLEEVILEGPTLFAPVISAAMNVARKDSDNPKYYCLLIITDGVLSDHAMKVFLI